MNEGMAEIARQLAELTAEIRANRADTKQLKESTEEIGRASCRERV